eukprot:GILI01017832.1.p1 GENE.GILI01017832.1~~GILI01017832.1.p1  ORF type:complete len:411 (-),score=77.58 GILI01017832.1:148-1380(-)
MLNRSLSTDTPPPSLPYHPRSRSITPPFLSRHSITIPASIPANSRGSPLTPSIEEERKLAAEQTPSIVLLSSPVKPDLPSELSSAASSPFLSSAIELLSEKEKAAFIEFKQKIYGPEVSADEIRLADMVVTTGGDRDRMLLRFLKARNFKVEKSYAMLKDCMHWRENEGVNTILARPFFSAEKLREMRRAGPHAFHKVDLKGRPIFIMKTGETNPAVYKAAGVTLEENIHYHLMCMEYQRHLFQRQLQQSGQYVDAITVIHDLSGFNMSILKGMLLQMLKAMAQQDSLYYPETLGLMFLVNAPWPFWAAWKVISPWLDRHTLTKIHILKDNGKETLLKHIAAENLPSFLGGSCACPGGCVCCAENNWCSSEMAEMDELVERNIRESGVGAGSSPVGAGAGAAGVTGVGSL